MKRLIAFVDRTLQPDTNPRGYVLLILAFHVGCFLLALLIFGVLHLFHISPENPVIQIGFGMYLVWLFWLKKKRSKKNVAS